MFSIRRVDVAIIRSAFLGLRPWARVVCLIPCPADWTGLPREKRAIHEEWRLRVVAQRRQEGQERTRRIIPLLVQCISCAYLFLLSCWLEQDLSVLVVVVHDFDPQVDCSPFGHPVLVDMFTPLFC